MGGVGLIKGIDFEYSGLKECYVFHFGFAFGILLTGNYLFCITFGKFCNHKSSPVLEAISG